MFFPILFARIKESAYLYRKYFYYSPLNVKIMASRRELKKNVNYIAGELFDQFPCIEKIELRLSKRNPPMGADIESAGIELQCSRDE